MSDKRTSTRVRRRLPVTFSDGQRHHQGQTANVSRTGACIHSDYVVTPGTELMLTLTLPGIAEVKVLGQVEWARKLRGTEVLQSAHSMGVRFVTPPGTDYDTFMGMIEGLAQAHGLATRGEPVSAREPPPAPAGRAPAPAARRRPPGTPPPVEVAPLPREPEPRLAGWVDARTTPRHDGGSATGRSVGRPRRVDPRGEPDDTPRPRRDVVYLHAPATETPGPQDEAAPSAARPARSLDFIVGPDDLAAPRGYPASLSTARVAWLLEQGAAELAATRLRPHTTTAGLSLEVEVPAQPLAVGTALAVTVALASTGADRRTFGFEIEVRAGQRVVATGRHVRVVVEAGSGD